MNADPLCRIPTAFGRLLGRSRAELKLTEEALAVAAGLPDAPVRMTPRACIDLIITSILGISVSNSERTVPSTTQRVPREDSTLLGDVRD